MVKGEEKGERERAVNDIELENITETKKQNKDNGLDDGEVEGHVCNRENENEDDSKIQVGGEEVGEGETEKGVCTIEEGGGEAGDGKRVRDENVLGEREEVGSVHYKKPEKKNICEEKGEEETDEGDEVGNRKRENKMDGGMDRNLHFAGRENDVSVIDVKERGREVGNGEREKKTGNGDKEMSGEVGDGKTGKDEDVNRIDDRDQEIHGDVEDVRGNYVVVVSDVEERGGEIGDGKRKKEKEILFHVMKQDTKPAEVRRNDQDDDKAREQKGGKTQTLCDKERGKDHHWHHQDAKAAQDSVMPDGENSSENGEVIDITGQGREKTRGTHGMKEKKSSSGCSSWNCFSRKRKRKYGEKSSKKGQLGRDSEQRSLKRNAESR